MQGLATIRKVLQLTAIATGLAASGVVAEVKLPQGFKPLFDTPLRDTSVCLGPDGTYYLTGTTGAPTWWESNDGIRLWKSKDLATWEPVGLVWSFEKDATWQKGAVDKNGKLIRAIWAPEIHFINGTFCIAYSVNYRRADGQYAGTGLLRSASGQAEGPYRDVKADGPLTPDIDASLFQDDDGSVYFLYAAGWIARMKDDLSGLAEEPRLIRPAGAPRVGYEGAFLFKANGRYHLSCADINPPGSKTHTYDCMVASAPALAGPWSERYLAIPHGGHNAFFKDRQGQWWSTFFGSDATAPFRERPALLRVAFGPGGRVQPAPEAEPRKAPQARPLPFQYTEGQTAPRDEVRDPCIIRDGDRYYLTFTMWPFRNREESRLGEPDQGGSPGIALYASKDLKAWTFAKWLVKSSELPENCPYKNRFWAPEIHKINGKHYLIFTADNWIKKEYNPAGSWGTAGHCFIGVADSVEGPYEHITWVSGGTCDMSLFGDSDGQVYALKPKRDLFIQKIDLGQLERDQVKWAGPEERVVPCGNADIGLAASPEYLEGPWLEKIGHVYCLYYAAIYKDAACPELLGYRTGAAYAESLRGPWRKDPRGQVFFGGHAAAFDGPDGRKWFSYRWEQDNSARGRLCADPVPGDAQGSPLR